MQFVVIAYDGTDPQAPARRQAARPAHLESAAQLSQTGNFLDGGAILDDDGKMIGSVMFMDFPSEKEVAEWLENDPYTKGDVWRDVTVKRFQRASHK